MRLPSWKACGLLLLISLHVSGQGVSNKGREFWLGFMSNENTTPSLSLRISSENATTGTVSVPLAGWSTTFSVAAGSIASVTIPNTYVATGSGIQDIGIRVTASDSVTVYASNFRSASFDATVVLPLHTLGTEYRTICYIPFSLTSNPSEFLVAATEDNTQLEIMATASGAYGTSTVAPYVPFSITLNKGQVFQLQSSSGDLTGSYIVSTNCKKFNVFSGNVLSYVPSTCQYGDHLYEQMYPVNTWGSSFISVPFIGTAARPMPASTLRAVSAYDSTTVTIKTPAGTASNLILSAGQYYEFELDTPAVITTDKPAAVVQYAQGSGCAGVGDPFMLWLSPGEQNRKSLVFASINIGAIQDHYANVIIKTDHRSSLLFNGASVPATAFSRVPSDTAYSYARLRCIAGYNTLKASDGFAAYIYGYGNTNQSYGYSAGSNTDNLLRIKAYCTLDSIVLTAPPGTSWLWSNGSTSRRIVVSQTLGYTHQVTVYNGCSSVTYSYTISINCNTSTVPLTLIQLSGKPITDGTSLTWTVLQEKPVEYYEVQKSGNGLDFLTSGKIAAIEGRGAKTYEFLDREPLAPMAYYRIRVVEKDGSSHYSHSIPVAPGTVSPAIRYWPQPLRQGEKLNLEYSSDNYTEIKIEIMDLQGRKVNKTKVISNKGSNTFLLDTSNLQRGCYIITINGQNMSVRRKLLLE